jgi:hypothetical protein
MKYDIILNYLNLFYDSKSAAPDQPRLKFDEWPEKGIEIKV